MEAKIVRKQLAKSARGFRHHQRHGRRQSEWLPFRRLDVISAEVIQLLESGRPAELVRRLGRRSAARHSIEQMKTLNDGGNCSCLDASDHLLGPARCIQYQRAARLPGAKIS